MVDQTTVSKLRLAYARRRIDAFLAQIDQLRASSFPHKDFELALDGLEEFARNEAANLDLPPNFDAEVIDKACFQIMEVVERHTHFLGFILRSTNVRNAFELHDPLRALIRKVIGDQARVLISAEWNFIPFTYPRNIDSLPNFVLIGTPATDAGNMLVAPLAGHEIGHSIWTRHDFAEALEQRIRKETSQVLEADEARTRRLLEEFGMNDLGISIVQDTCAKRALRQLEEIASDLLGLQIFGASYLYAYEYLLAPSGYPQDLNYPSERKRLHIMQEQSEALGIEVDGEVYERWKEKPVDPKRRDMFSVVNEIVDACMMPLRAKLTKVTTELSLDVPMDADIDPVLSAFENGVPFSGEASLGAIATAGWNYTRKRSGLAGDDQEKERRLVNDLMLKTIEVNEYNYRIADA
ncbi:hypothetical protein [Roseibium sp.]|uniref:hypothetical protein n=1 Tax=Roseibium sp. TaxID=1936156 RepID=UPI00329A1E0B